MSCYHSTQHDFCNRNGFQTQHWGPTFWLFLHSVALHIEESRTRVKEHARMVQQFKQLIYGLTLLLPCVYCRMSFEPFVADPANQIDLATDLFVWTVHAHNMVDRKLHKQERHDLVQLKRQYRLRWTAHDVEMLWQRNTWQLLFYLTLNFPVDFNRAIPRYESLRLQYMQIYKVVGDLIPSKKEKQVFAKQYHHAYEQDKTALATILERCTDNPGVMRDRLFHWLLSLQKQTGMCFTNQSDCLNLHDAIEQARSQ